MYLNSYVAAFDTIRFVPFNDIFNAGINYIPIGAPLQYPARMIVVHNMTDADLYMSNIGDNVAHNDKWFLPAQSGRVLDITSNTFNTPMSGIYTCEIGTRFYVREIDAPFTEVPTIKGVWLEITYGSEHQ